MAAPTNSDIMRILLEMTSTQSRIEEKVDRVEIQATKTNGRVNSIEEWKTGLQAVAALQEKNPGGQNISAPNATTVQVMQPSKWFQSEKLVGAIVVLILAVAAAVGFFTGGGQ